VHDIAKYYGNEDSFSMPLREILSFSERSGGAAFIRDPADPRTLIRLQDGIKKARESAQRSRQAKTAKYEMTKEELSNLINALEALLTTYRIQGLQVYTPKHTKEQVVAFEA